MKIPWGIAVDGANGAQGIVQLTIAQAVATSASQNFTALWWNASESGWGINVTQQGDILFATLFTYEAGGGTLWLVMSSGVREGTANIFTGDLYRTTGPAFNAVPFDPANVVVTDVGTGTFTFSSTASGTFAYTVNGVTQSKAIERQVYSAPATVCR